MNRLSRASQLLVMIALLSGCKPSEFGQAHLNELTKDCTESLNCSAGGGLAASSGVTITDCVHAAGDRLDEAGEAAQQRFLDTVDRCESFQLCDYLSCTMNDPNSGWAGTHQPLITYDCQQIVACDIANHVSVPMTAVDDCVSQHSNQYNATTPDVQNAFEAKGTRCAAQMGCAWMACM
ncbi:MAG TPA: hypothetical protein VGI70_19925 [Polyangiales bacterium]|jgi:hypothetical protein